jgi:hypothetical protein
MNKRTWKKGCLLGLLFFLVCAVVAGSMCVKGCFKTAEEEVREMKGKWRAFNEKIRQEEDAEAFERKLHQEQDGILVIQRDK